MDSKRQLGAFGVKEIDAPGLNAQHLQALFQRVVERLFQVERAIYRGRDVDECRQDARALGHTIF